MGTFYAGCVIENHINRKKSERISKLLVDTGSEHTWIPSVLLEKIGVIREKKDVLFVMANGQQVTRNVGFAIIRINKYFTIDEVVFGEVGDMPLLGARTLEGLNLSVDPREKKLVAAGPLPAAHVIFPYQIPYRSLPDSTGRGPVTVRGPVTGRAPAWEISRRF